MLWISFFRPRGCFAGAFNNFAAWWTNGEFCHCELVVEGDAEFLLSHIQQVYIKHMRTNDARSVAIVQELERAVMNKRTRRMIHAQRRGWISFSLLFGDQLRLRALDAASTDPWFATPHQTTEHVVWKSIAMDADALVHIYNWCLEEVSKPYDNTGALMSWLPSMGQERANVPKHFCSEFCVRALQRAGHVHSLCASHTTPNKLYNVLQNYVPPYATEERVGLDVEELVEEESMQALEAMMVDSDSD